MLFPFAILASAFVTFVLVIFMWPLALQPALRRRYERAHHRRKARRRVSR